MAYTINLTDGTIFATIADGTVNTSSSMILVGKNYAGYGEFLDENFIHLLENGSNTTAPSSPLTGQMWWDKTNNLMKVYSGAGGWKTISAATSAASAPTNNVTGDLWYDTINQQLNVWTGAAFIVVGPAFTSSQGKTGAVPETINDSGATPHFITSLYVNDIRVAIVSKDASFTPAPPINTAFPTVYTGITLASSGLGASAVFAGSATNAQTLDSLDSTDFMRATANTSTTGILRVQNNTGLFVGSANVFNVNTTATDANIKSNVSGGNLIIQANVGGTTYNVAQALGASGTFAVSNALTVGTIASVTGNITGANINTGGVVSAAGNVVGGNVVAVAAVSGVSLVASGNVDAGNLRTGGLVSATGNIISAANISGQYIIGNGSQLTGLSAAVSVTKIENGTSKAEINASGGNLAVTIGGTANVVVFDATTIYGNVVSVQSISKTGTNAVGNIGSSSNYFNRVFATATTALYADVAERFEADEMLEPGTVVELGGTKEITRAKDELTESVFGVISTRAAYLMNGAAGDDDTHPPVAMTGRVPVKVVGYVKKGDRLVSAGNGIARAATKQEITPFNVIGRSLVDKHTPDESTIEAIVTIKN